MLHRWNKYLAKFVNSLCKHLNKRLAKEATAYPHPHPGSGTPNGDRGQQSRQQLSTATQRCLARVILRMADKAQYSKVGSHWGSGLGGVGVLLVLNLVQHKRHHTKSHKVSRAG